MLRPPMDTSTLTFDTPLGTMAVTAHGSGVVHLRVGSRAGSTAEGESGPDEARALCAETRRQLEAYLLGKLQTFDVPVDLSGSEFQQAVWRVMSEIPYGESQTYGEVARELEQPGASRAVGAACGANPVPLIVPCHRIVAAGGRLGGFGLGRERKIWLLDLESHGRPPGRQQRLF